MASLATVARRVVFYDLETSIVAKAEKRGGAAKTLQGRRNLIVEIGAVCTHGMTFHRLVDPRLPGLSLSDTFEHTQQNAEATLRFWNRLFREKGMLHKARRGTKRAPIETRLATYDQFFDTPPFVGVRQALSQFIHFVFAHSQRPPLVIAHNGNSFDHSILRAHTHTYGLPAFDRRCMRDSLTPARHILPGMKSHSLGALHRKLVTPAPFDAHHALSDARALSRVCHALAAREGVPLHCLWSPQHGSLTSVKGIGPKTARALRRAHYTLPSLKAAVQQHAQCPAALRPCIRNHKALWKSLRKAWASQVTTPPRSPRRGRPAAQRTRGKCRRRAKSL